MTMLIMEAIQAAAGEPVSQDVYNAMALISLGYPVGTIFGMAIDLIVERRD